MEFLTTTTMEKLIKIQWKGRAPTMVRKENGGTKVEVKPGDTVEVTEQVGKVILNAYKGEWVKVEGGEVVPAKEEKTVTKTPAKGKKSKGMVEEDDIEKPEDD